MTNLRKKLKFAHSLQTLLKRRAFLAILLSSLLISLSACTFPVRTGYDRKTGAYKSAPASAPTQTDVSQQNTNNKQSQTPPAKAAAVKQDSTKHKKTSPAKAREAITKKEVARAAPKKSTSLEDAIKPWMGTRYKLGGTTKSGIDCSGYVMVIYKQAYGISLDHHAETIYKDSRGSKVSRGSLKEGDLIFFGDFWGISHVGIYLNGDRFTHASTSKGVMISPMNDKYWSPKYKGARRFK